MAKHRHMLHISNGYFHSIYCSCSFWVSLCQVRLFFINHVVTVLICFYIMLLGLCLVRSWGNLVSIVTRLWAGQPGFDSQKGGRDFSSLSLHPTGSGAHTASYPVGTGVFSPGNKVASV
jgi:hypothetical protein